MENFFQRNFQRKRKQVGAGDFFLRNLICKRLHFSFDSITLLLSCERPMGIDELMTRLNTTEAKVATDFCTGRCAFS